MTILALLSGEPDFRRSGVFRFLYLPLAVAYIGLTLFWGRYDLRRVHQDYREIGERLAGGHSHEQAGREVAAGCRQATGGEKALGYNDCLRASAHLIELRAAVIDGELRRDKHRAFKKMAVSYLLVGVLMILLPLTLLYIFLAFLRYLLASVRLKKE